MSGRSNAPPAPGTQPDGRLDDVDPGTPRPTTEQGGGLATRGVMVWLGARVTPNKDVTPAIQRFLDALAFANRMYDGRRPDDMSRSAAALALSAVITLVESVVEDRHELTQPIRDLGLALVDLSRGKTSPMLRPSPLPGHRDPLSREVTKGAAAAAMSSLMAVGYRLKEAARLVADELDRGGVKLESERADRRRVTFSTVASWRAQVHGKIKAAPAGSRSVAVEIYRVCMENWPPPDDLNLQQDDFRALALEGLSGFLAYGAT
jgi:hypothetical protein